VRPFGLCDGAFDSHVVYFPVVIPALSLAFEVCVGTPIVARIVPWVGKASFYCWGSWSCGGGGGGGLFSILTWGLLFCFG
jgi:hypothetical protein